MQSTLKKKEIIKITQLILHKVSIQFNYALMLKQTLNKGSTFSWSWSLQILSTIVFFPWNVGRFSKAESKQNPSTRSPALMTAHSWNTFVPRRVRLLWKVLSICQERRSYTEFKIWSWARCYLVDAPIHETLSSSNTVTVPLLCKCKSLYYTIALGDNCPLGSDANTEDTGHSEWMTSQAISSHFWGNCWLFVSPYQINTEALTWSGTATQDKELRELSQTSGAKTGRVSDDKHLILMIGTFLKGNWQEKKKLCGGAVGGVNQKLDFHPGVWGLSPVWIFTAILFWFGLGSKNDHCWD